MRQARILCLLLGSLLATAGWQDGAAAQVKVQTLDGGMEATISTSCMLAVMTAATALQRDFNLQQLSAGTRLDFDEVFLRFYGSVGCYEDAEGFILYFRPAGHAGGADLRGTYMFRMARDHTIEYAAPMR